MPERTDHAKEARYLLEMADRHVSENWPAQTGEHKADILAAAQVHATLALVEQQRVANLIALANGSYSHAARAQAEMALYERFPAQGGIELPLHGDIAAALGIGGDPHQHDPTCSKHGDRWPCMTPQASCVAECAECSETLGAGGDPQ